MTRAEIIEFVNYLEDYPCTLPMVIDHQYDQDAFRTNWISCALPEWADILLDILINPPENVKENVNWFFQISEILGEWGRKEPLLIVPKIGPLLSNIGIRAFILDACCYINDVSVLPWLIPLTTHWSDLSEGEVDDLINAVGQVKSKAADDILKRLADAIPEKQTGLHETLRFFMP